MFMVWLTDVPKTRVTLFASMVSSTIRRTLSRPTDQEDDMVTAGGPSKHRRGTENLSISVKARSSSHETRLLLWKTSLPKSIHSMASIRRISQPFAEFLVSQLMPL